MLSLKRRLRRRIRWRQQVSVRDKNPLPRRSGGSSRSTGSNNRGRRLASLLDCPLGAGRVKSKESRIDQLRRITAKKTDEGREKEDSQ